MIDITEIIETAIQEKLVPAIIAVRDMTLAAIEANPIFAAISNINTIIAIALLVVAVFTGMKIRKALRNFF